MLAAIPPPQRWGGARLKELSNRDTALGPGEGRAERESEEHKRALPAGDTHCPCSLLGTSGHSTDGPSPQLIP